MSKSGANANGHGRAASASPPRSMEESQAEEPRSKSATRVEETAAVDPPVDERAGDAEIEVSSGIPQPTIKIRTRVTSKMGSEGGSVGGSSHGAEAAKEALENGSQNTLPRKIFVGGLPLNIATEPFKEYFSQFGEVEDSVVMFDPVTKRSRGFGFITFAHDSAVDWVLAMGNIHQLLGKKVEVKRAIPKAAMVATSASSPKARNYDQNRTYSRRSQHANANGSSNPRSPSGIDIASASDHFAPPAVPYWAAAAGSPYQLQSPLYSYQDHSPPIMDPNGPMFYSTSAPAVGVATMANGGWPIPAAPAPYATHVGTPPMMPAYWHPRGAAMPPPMGAAPMVHTPTQAIPIPGRSASHGHMMMSHSHSQLSMSSGSGTPGASSAASSLIANQMQADARAAASETDVGADATS